MTLSNSECIRNNPTKPWDVKPQNVTFQLLNLPAVASLTAWRSVLFGANPFAFEQEVNVDVINNTVTILIQPNSQARD
jgi:hypothetical protein